MGTTDDLGPWSDNETRELIKAYFGMLADETAGRQYSKIEYNRRVQAATGRSKGSIEFKFCNISHVLDEEGVVYVDGYKPRSHVQDSLRTAVRRALGLALDESLGAETSDSLAHDKDPAGRSGTILSPATEQKRGLVEVLGGLWERSTGGTDVAARPDHPVDSLWPSALRPAGVEEACDWLSEEAAVTALPRYLFLIGGPGAGKSHATARVVEQKGLTLKNCLDDGLAHRTYTFSGRDSDLIIVNDATISAEEAHAPLAEDIDQAAALSFSSSDRRTDFMACVNRGILVEELASLRRHGIQKDSAGATILSWLGDDLAGGESSWRLEDKSQHDYVRSARLEEAGRVVAHVIAVFVDECSLFEERPSAAIIGNSVEKTAPYRITRIKDRVSLSETKMPAGDLLVRILGVISEGTETDFGTDSPSVDPLEANVISLRSARTRSSLLTIGRSAELSSSLRMTYRELWGFLVRALVGNAPMRMDACHLAEFIRVNQPEGVDSREDFRRLKRLSSLRVTQGIFGAGEESGVEESGRRDPVLRLTAGVDPVRDALPGDQPFDPSRGWTTPLTEAFTSHHSEGTPLDLLLRYDRQGYLADMVAPFDRHLDSAYGDLMREGSLSDSERIEAIEWYGAYLTRLYGVAYGISAFRREISALVQALVQVPYVPDTLENQLHTLIRPKRDPSGSSSESLLPLFDSRTDPITGRLAAPKLAIRTGDIELRTRRSGGEQVFLELHRNGRIMGKIALDFALVREALTCEDNRPGVTNLVDVTAPRLERIRASRLLAGQLIGAEFRVAVGQDGHHLSQPES